MKTTHDNSRRTVLGLNSTASRRQADTGGIHIAGVVVHTRPEKFARVRDGLMRLSGAEIHAADPRGKLVVTLEGASDGVIADLLHAIPDIPGVIACTLAHHHSESSADGAA